MDLVSKHVSCPHCGHSFHLMVEPTEQLSEFIEDCPNCCSNILIHSSFDEGSRQLSLVLDAEDEQFY